MRYNPKLTKRQVQYLIRNAHLSNKELAKKLGTTPNIIANYKYRARQEGIDIPRNSMPKFEDSTINVMKEAAKKKETTKKQQKAE